MSTYPATNSNEAVELVIDGGNQLHEIINGDATSEVITESGPIPSVRKALTDTFLFQDPLPWDQGSDETAFNQLRTFDGSIYWAPTATLSTPAPMGATPIGDSNWNLAPVNSGGYKGLWPDTGGSALKGEIWQTQVGGTPTGEYYTALQDTSVDPVGDNVNWVSQTTKSYIDAKNQQQDSRISQLEESEKKAVIFIPYGQSNARGRPSKVSSAYGGLYTFNGGSQKGDDSASQTSILNAVKESDMRTAVPYSEFGRDEETTPPGFSSQVVGSGINRVYAWTGAIGSRHWRELKPATGPWSSFSQAIAQFTKLAKDAGIVNLDYVVYWDHGESEADNLAPGNNPTDTPITKNEYKQVLSSVRRDMERAIAYATDTTNPSWKLLVTPINFSGVSTAPTFTYDQVQQAQHEFCLENDDVFMVGGKSQFEVEPDNIHVTGLGRRYLAEQAGVAYNEIARSGSWSAPYMVGASISGNVITVQCSEDITIDETVVSDTAQYYTGTKYGLEMFSDGVQVGISNVTALGDVLTVTLSSTPTGLVNEIKCAQIVTPTNTTVADLKPRTSIRSSSKEFTSKLDGQIIYNFMTPHKIEVI